MNGAESLVHTLLGGGIDVCFSNPGTSEMHFVAALDRIPGMRCVLALQENVVTGAADGYWRMAEKPAATLLHCGPGLANGLANLHNSMRAHSGVVNVVGDQATYHRPLDAPLTADTTGWAAGVSGFVRACSHASRVGADAADAIAAARGRGGQVATLVLPADTAWGDGGVAGTAMAPLPLPHAAPETVAGVARILKSGEPAMIVLGGAALREGPQRTAGEIAAATGARLIAPMSVARIARGAGRLALERVPYPVDLALAALAGIKHLILVGAKPPVAFFAYPNKPGYLFPADCAVHVLATQEEDHVAALEALHGALGAKAAPLPATQPSTQPPGQPPGQPLEAATGAITPESFGQSLSALLPEGAVVVDESITFGRALFRTTHAAAPHDWIQLTGGAIGEGLPLATGAAVGAPGRRVVTLQADGSALYTVQALWTQARERLDVTTVIFANRKYQILLGELAAVGANPGRTALEMLDLGNPDIDWVRLAGGLGVEAARAETMEEFNELFAASLRRRGPFLIELACQ